MPIGDSARAGNVRPAILRTMSHITQRLICGVELKAGDSNVGKRQKQADDHEKVNDDHLKRDGATWIRYESAFLAHKPTSTGATKDPIVKTSGSTG